MKYQTISTTRTFMGKLDHGCDLITALTDFCKKEGVTSGKIEALGAVSQATLQYYDQNKKIYTTYSLDSHLEITNLVGNISLKDGAPIIHAHITLSDEKGRAFGGHLTKGTAVFACEFVVTAFDSDSFQRGFDDVTGLPLWQDTSFA